MQKNSFIKAMSLSKKIVQHSKNIFSHAKKKIYESKKSQKTIKEENKNATLEFSFPQIGPRTENRVIADISLLSAIKIIAVIFGIIILGEFLKATAEILISFFLALFLSSALYPGVSFLEKKKIPRGAAIGIVFLGVLGTFIFLLSNLLPALIAQFIALGEWIAANIEKIYFGDFSPLPNFLQHFGPDIQNIFRDLDVYIKKLGTDSQAQQGLFQVLKDNISKIEPWKDGIGSFVSGFFSFLSSFVLVLLFSFFILFDRESLKKFFLSFFAPKTRKYAAKKSEQMQMKIAEWIHGQMILFMFMGGITWIFLTIMGVDYALSLGFLTGLAEFIPYLGPFVAFSISAPIAFGSGPEVGFAVVIFFAVLQLIEGNILVPMVMSRAVGVSPLVTILAMLVGFEFLGVIGAILAIPLASIISLFIFDIQKKEECIFCDKEEKNSAQKNISP